MEKGTIITMTPLQKEDLPQFKREVRAAFSVTVEEVFGSPENGPLPSDADIDGSLAAADAHGFLLAENGRHVGGAIVRADAGSGKSSLELFYLLPEELGKGIGFRAWQTIEAAFPQTRVWELYTPCFDKRNVHFYVNKCGFCIVEYFNAHHPDPHGIPGVDFFRFEKQMR